MALEHAPEKAAETIRLAIGVGLAGGSIEDASGDSAKPIYDFNLAVERIAAAVEAVRAQDIPFTLTARAENFLHGRPDLDDTIKRLQAFEKAGADVLYAPGLPSLEAIREVCAAVTRPVNVLAGRGLYAQAIGRCGGETRERWFRLEPVSTRCIRKIRPRDERTSAHSILPRTPSHTVKSTNS